MKKLALLLSLLALAAFGVAACGDDEEEPAAETTAEETTESAGGGAGGTIQVSADPGGDLAYEQDSLEATAGPNTIEFTNDSSTPHDVVIEDDGGNEVARTDQITGDVTTAEAELEAGEYTFYCSVPGHRDAGMEGPLTVN
jgi:plastocyanin